MVRCQAPGCGQWFRKNSNRHIYCKLPGCTFRRNDPPSVEVQQPEGASEELLRRLQDPEGGGAVSGELFPARLRAVGDAQRRGDSELLYGALLDAAVVLVAAAERARRGQPVQLLQAQRTAPPVAPQGLSQAVWQAFGRMVVLAERRVDAVWELVSAREAFAGARAGVEQTKGTQQSVEAEALAQDRRAALAAAERALQTLEAAWAERKVAVTELQRAAVPSNGNGGARGVRRVA
jgi:hypothetical protein